MAKCKTPNIRMCTVLMTHCVYVNSKYISTCAEAITMLSVEITLIITNSFKKYTNFQCSVLYPWATRASSMCPNVVL